MYSLQPNEPSRNTLTSINGNDVSFSIPEWKNQQLKSLNNEFEKEIYRAVPVSLTDFDSRDQIQFLTKPQKSMNEKYAYERKLIRPQDFSILAFIVCFEQTLLADGRKNNNQLENFKKSISELDLCVFTDVPTRMQKQYDNKVLKKILFQYINKGSYNVSLLEILIRKNQLLKFALSLVSKAILYKRSIIHSYNERVSCYIEMKVCGDYFQALESIKVRDKTIESQNFFIDTSNHNNIRVLRKQNIIKQKTQMELKKQNSIRPKTPQVKKTNSILRQRSKSRSRQKSRQRRPSSKIKKDSYLKKNDYQSTKSTATRKPLGLQKRNTGTSSTKNRKQKQDGKRSNSLVNLFKRLICY